MNPHTPHPDEGQASADPAATDRPDAQSAASGLPATDTPAADRPAAAPASGLPATDVPAAGQPGAAPDAGPGTSSPEPPRLYPSGDPEGPYAVPPFPDAAASQGGTWQAGPSGGAWQPGPAPGPQGQNFFDWIRGQGLYRGRDRWIGGVASGIAHRLGVDPLIVRGVLIVLTIFAGLGVLAYGVAWALLPEPDGRIHVQEAAAGRWSAGMTGALVTTVIGFPSLGTGIWGWNRFGFGAFVWTVFWVGGAIYLVYYLTHRTTSPTGDSPVTSGYAPSSPAGAATLAGPARASAEQHYAEQKYAGGFPPAGVPAHDQDGSGTGPAWGAPPPSGPAPYGPVPPGPVPPGSYGPGPTPPPAAPRRFGPGTPAVAITVGSALLVGGGIKALDAAHVIDLGNSGNALVWAIAAGILGLGILFAGLRGRSSGILGFLAVVALLIGGIFSVVPHGDRFRLQNADWTPSSVAQATGGFEITGGTGTLDLTKTSLNPPLTSDVVVPIQATASNLTVVIPGTVPVQIQADMTMGSLHEGGQDRGGMMNQQSDYNTTKPGARMVVKISGTVSNVTIKEGN